MLMQVRTLHKDIRIQVLDSHIIFSTMTWSLALQVLVLRTKMEMYMGIILQQQQFRLVFLFLHVLQAITPLQPPPKLCSSSRVVCSARTLEMSALQILTTMMSCLTHGFMWSVRTMIPIQMYSTVPSSSCWLLVVQCPFRLQVKMFTLCLVSRMMRWSTLSERTKARLVVQSMQNMVLIHVLSSRRRLSLPMRTWLPV